jgi:hypothetical protein
MQTEHLNQVQLAHRWSFSPRTLAQWRWLGKGPPYLKVGRRALYRLEDIERYEAEQLHIGTSLRTVAPPSSHGPATASTHRPGRRLWQAPWSK